MPEDASEWLARARGCWYVPDPSQAGDLEKVREKALLKEFEAYRISPRKRLAVLRLEAVRAGFRHHHRRGPQDSRAHLLRRGPRVPFSPIPSGRRCPPDLVRPQKKWPGGHSNPRPVSCFSSAVLGLPIPHNNCPCVLEVLAWERRV